MYDYRYLSHAGYRHCRMAESAATAGYGRIISSSVVVTAYDRIVWVDGTGWLLDCGWKDGNLSVPVERYARSAFYNAQRGVYTV